MSTDAHALTPPQPSWKLWTIGTLALLWNAMGAFDYLMTQTRNAAYLSNMTQAQMAYIDAFPTWAVATWATAVWGGVLGTVLLLSRRRLAVPVFLVSLVAMVLTTVYQYGVSNGLEVFPGVGPKLFTAAIFLVALGLYLYSRALAHRGVLH